MNQLVFTKSERGADILVHEGFLYHYCKAYENGELYYKCIENRTKHKCKITVNLNASKNLIKKAPSGSHNHQVPSIHVPVVKRLRHNIKERVKSEPRSKCLFQNLYQLYF